MERCFTARELVITRARLQWNAAALDLLRCARRNSGSDGAVESPSSDAQLTDENAAEDETWSETYRDSSDTSSAGADVGLLRDPPNYYEAVQYLRQVRRYTVRLLQ